METVLLFSLNVNVNDFHLESGTAGSGNVTCNNIDQSEEELLGVTIFYHQKY